MSVDVSTLEIRVISDAVEQAEKRLRALEEQGGRNEKGVDQLAGAFMRLAGPLAGAVSIMEGFQKLVEVTREFEVLNAGLITATGSAENASVAFDAIQQFAASTPYDLQQVTAGFTKLVNYGLKPSEAALTAYGNTASAMGKNLNDMVEAVADASTGEFERLKEFGIRAAKQGDEVSFTFRGVTTTVKNSSEEIQNYLIALGENNFAGAMAQRMDTLDGALSNLGDSWDSLFRNISNLGTGDLIESSVRMATDSINGLNSLLASGQMSGYIDALGSLFGGLGEDIQRAFTDASNIISEFVGENGDDIAKFVDDALAEIIRLPADFRSWIQAAVVQIVSNLQEVGSEFQALAERTKAVFTGDTIEAASQRNLDRLRAIRSARESSLEAITQERDASIAGFYAQIEAADQARQSFDAAANAKGGVLGQFEQAGGGGSPASGGSTGKKPGKKSEDGADGLSSSIMNLQYELQQEEELLSASYARRFEEKTIWDAINDQAMTTTFSRKMENWAQEEEMRRDMLAREEAEIQESYIRRQNQLNAWYNNDATKKAQFDKMTLQNLQKFNKEKEQLQKASEQNQLSNSAIFAGAALNILTTLFSDSKPIAIAAALMSTYQGAANALATVPYPANIAAAATVVASGIAQVNNIRSTNVGGGGGGGGAVAPSIPSSISNNTDLTTSTLPTTAQTEPPITRTITVAHEINGRPATDDDVVKLGSLRPLIEALNEEIKMGNLRIVM